MTIAELLSFPRASETPLPSGAQSLSPDDVAPGTMRRLAFNTLARETFVGVHIVRLDRICVVGIGTIAKIGVLNLALNLPKRILNDQGHVRPGDRIAHLIDEVERLGGIYATCAPNPEVIGLAIVGKSATDVLNELVADSGPGDVHVEIAEDLR